MCVFHTLYLCYYSIAVVLEAAISTIPQYTYCALLLCPFSCLELIIEEQVEKLNATLRGIETLSVVARDTASKLTELIGADEVGGEREGRREGGREGGKEGRREGGGAGRRVDRWEGGREGGGAGGRVDRREGGRV